MHQCTIFEILKYARTYCSKTNQWNASCISVTFNIIALADWFNFYVAHWVCVCLCEVVLLFGWCERVFFRWLQYAIQFVAIIWIFIRYGCHSPCTLIAAPLVCNLRIWLGYFITVHSLEVFLFFSKFHNLSEPFVAEHVRVHLRTRARSYNCSQKWESFVSFLFFLFFFFYDFCFSFLLFYVLDLKRRYKS